MIRRRPAVIANEIRMRRSQQSGTFLLVEGRDDRLFYEKFVDLSRCSIVVAETKEDVAAVLKILDVGGFSGVVGLVDSDFEKVDGAGRATPNLIMTDLHDIECMMLRSSALQRMLGEYVSRQKLERFGRDVLGVLVAAASPIGSLRLHSARKGLALRFDGLRYARCVNRQTLEIDMDALVSEVKDRSNRPDIPNEALVAAIQAIGPTVQDVWQICVGTDLLGVLAIGLRHALGSNKSTDVEDQQLRRSLRLAYGDDDFAGTEVLRQLRAWEAQNDPFRVFGG
jgi:hypothetical protein